MKDLFFSPVFQGVRKFSALLVCVLFVFVFIVSPIKVYALDYPIPIPAVPINSYSIDSLKPDFELLNDDQKKIVHELLGIQSTVFFGLGYWPYTAQTIGNSLTREKLQEVGRTFLNTFMSSILGTPRAMQDLVGSVTHKASTYEDYDDYVADTTTIANGGNSDTYYLEYPWELTVAYKNWFAVNGGVYDWQFSAEPFDTSQFAVVFNPQVMSNSTQASYDSYIVNNYTTPWVRGINTSVSNARFSAQQFVVYHNLFFDETYNTCYICDDLGRQYSNSFRVNAVYVYSNRAYYSADWISVIFESFSTVPFSSYRACIDAINDGSVYVTRNGSGIYNCLSLGDFITHVYHGADWSSKQEIYDIDDLSIGHPTSNYIDNVGDTMYVDATGVIDDIADGVTDTNQLVRDNTLVRDNDRAIPYEDAIIQAIDKYLSTPSSGVVIPTDLFSPLTGPDGPVSYLWFMTKPLVSFTRDIIDLLTYDSDGTFQFTGLGYIVVGVVTCGIIGGLVTKCLL